MGRSIYCMLEVYDEKSKTWLNKELNFVTLSVRDFFDDYYRYIFRGQDALPVAQNYLHPVSKGVAELMRSSTQQSGYTFKDYFDFKYYTISDFKVLLNALTREYYCRNIYNELVKDEELNDKAEKIDRIADLVNEITLSDKDFRASVGKLLRGNSKDVYLDYTARNELDDTYDSMHYCLLNLLSIYSRILTMYIDHKEQKLILSEDIDNWDDYARYDPIDENENVRVVFYFSC